MKTFLVIAIITTALTSQAKITQPCPENLTIECKASYLNAKSKVVLTKESKSNFADENWDEPSLKNCAATIYLSGTEVAGTTVRIYAQKDLTSQQLQISAGASQTKDTTLDGQVVRQGYYSNVNELVTTVGQETALGNLVLPLKIRGTIDRVNVTCNSHY